MVEPDLYSNDPSHPIPDLDVIDVNVVKKGGGSDLVIVIATPLAGDSRSLERLLGKIERYLAFSGSNEFVRESGVATPDNTRIVVKIHPLSDPAAFRLLEQSKAWTLDNGISLTIDTHIFGLASH